MKNMKVFLLILFYVCLLFITPIYADIGPKPSVTITIEGVENNVEYYGALFAEISQYGPHSSSYEYSEYYEPKEIWDKFVEYDRKDAFYFWGNYEKLENNHEIHWGYYPPKTFKVILYFPTTNSYLISDIYSTYAFDSYYSMNISNVNEQGNIKLKKNYDYTWEIISFIVRAIATILIEVSIAKMYFKKNKKVFKLLIIINTVTQIVLNLLLNVVSYYSDIFTVAFYYIFTELAIIVIEGIIYLISIPKLESSKKAGEIIRYALVSNVVSFMIGVILANLIPGIF